MARTKHEEVEFTRGCSKCSNFRNQAARHIHFLQFPSEGSLAGHLKENLSKEDQQNEKGNTGIIRAICAWYSAIHRLYDEVRLIRQDGTTMPLWEKWITAQGSR